MDQGDRVRRLRYELALLEQMMTDNADLADAVALWSAQAAARRTELALIRHARRRRPAAPGPAAVTAAAGPALGAG